MKKRFEDLEKSDLEKISKSLWNKSTKTYKANLCFFRNFSPKLFQI